MARCSRLCRLGRPECGAWLAVSASRTQVLVLCTRTRNQERGIHYPPKVFWFAVRHRPLIGCFQGPLSAIERRCNKFMKKTTVYSVAAILASIFLSSVTAFLLLQLVAAVFGGYMASALASLIFIFSVPIWLVLPLPWSIVYVRVAVPSQPRTASVWKMQFWIVLVSLALGIGVAVFRWLENLHTQDIFIAASGSIAAWAGGTVYQIVREQGRSR